MHDHHHGWRERLERHARRGWGHGHEGHGHRGWGGRHGLGGGRFFEQGDLRLVVLTLLGENARHGYELIKEIEELSGGLYAPSPGVIYPLLTMLEEMGLARLASDEGSKKRYELTELGHEELTSKRAESERLLVRVAEAKERVSGGRSPQVMRAMENLRYALRLRFERGPLTEEQAQAVAAALDAAAQAVEKA